MCMHKTQESLHTLKEKKSEGEVQKTSEPAVTHTQRHPRERLPIPLRARRGGSLGASSAAHPSARRLGSCAIATPKKGWLGGGPGAAGKSGRLLREHAPRQRLCARLTLQCRAPTFQTRRGASRPPAYVRDTLEPCDLSEVSLPSCIRLVGEQHLQHVDVAFAGSEV